jgi:rhamnosyltransferase
VIGEGVVAAMIEMKEAANTDDPKRGEPTARTIAAIVVTYDPDAGLAERAEIISSQVGTFIIVDNHSSQPSMETIKKTCVKLGIHLIPNDENLGVATALNQGIRYAKDCGCDWALTLDQDTTPYSTMVQNLIAAYRGCPLKLKVGIIGSNFQDRNTGRVLLDNRGFPDSSWEEVDEIATSGSLVSIAAFSEVGPFRDELFIDYVDFEYCLRLKENGYKIIAGRKIGMVHAAGNAKMHRVLWRRIWSYHHPPIRSYYRARNAFLLGCEYLWKDPRWAMHALMLPIKLLLKTVLCEEMKGRKLKYICMGVWHGLVRKLGRQTRLWT